MFWALAFPLILGTLFYVSFGNTGLAGTGETDWEPVPVAIVTVESSSANAASFLTFLNETDQDMIDIHSYKTEKAAKKALRREEISGIYYVKSVPSLTIASNGINQSILSSLLDSYEKNADMIRDIATQHPEKLSDALSSLNDYQTLVKEKSLGGHSLDPTLTYFLALIAFACLSGVYLSIHSTVQLQANLSALGERRSITPTHKLSLILGDLLVLESIHFVNILILELYLTRYFISVLGMTFRNFFSLHLWEPDRYLSRNSDRMRRQTVLQCQIRNRCPRYTVTEFPCRPDVRWNEKCDRTALPGHQPDQSCQCLK